MARVVPGTSTAHVSGSFESVDIERHGGGGDSHVFRQRTQVGRFDGVEVIEDRGLRGTECLPRFLIAHMPAMAGKVNLRIRPQDSIDLAGQGHEEQDGIISLMCQTNYCIHRPAWPGTVRNLPADVSDARDRLDTQLKAVITAMQKRDNAQAEQSLQSFEDTVSVIEKYLGQ